MANAGRGHQLQEAVDEPDTGAQHRHENEFLALEERRLGRPDRRLDRAQLGRQIAQQVFGQIKQGLSFCQFLLRGVDKVRDEWAMICAGQNLAKLASAA
jgi:Transposase DDE domain